MATKNYMINDKWLDIDKENIVELQSVDGEIGSVKVNGEDYGGGGGSSDFSTAEVTVNNTYGENPLILNGGIVNTTDNRIDYFAIINDGEEAEVTIALYKGETSIDINANDPYLMSGNISFDDDLDEFEVTGDCVISTEPVWWFKNLTGVSVYDEFSDSNVFAVTPPFELTAQQCADMVSNNVQFMTIFDGTIKRGLIFEDDGYRVQVGNKYVRIQPLIDVTYPQFNGKVYIPDIPQGSHTLSIGFCVIEPLTQS